MAVRVPRFWAFRRFYEVLGVPEDADASAIRQAYREAAKACHPDLNPGRADERFKRLAEAYEVIGDPEQRGKYDALLRELRRPRPVEVIVVVHGMDFSIGNNATGTNTTTGNW